MLQKKQENKAPDKDAILKATASLSTRHTDRTVTQHNIRDVWTSEDLICISAVKCLVNTRYIWSLSSVFLLFLVFQFQTELRKILVSLIEVAQKLLALNPDAVELFKKANGKVDNPLKPCTSLRPRNGGTFTSKVSG